MDLEALRRRGVSRTRLAPVTNPARSAAWRLMLPFLEQLAQAMGEVVRTADSDRRELAGLRDHVERLAQAVHEAARAAELDRRALAGHRDHVERLALATGEAERTAELHRRELAEHRDLVEREHVRLDYHERRFEAAEARIEDALTLPPQAVARMHGRLSGIHKDLAAAGHRLASIEARLGQNEAAGLLHARLGSHEEAIAEQASKLERMNVWLDALGRENAALSARLDEALAEASVDRRAAEARGKGLSVGQGPMGRFLVWPQDLIGRLVMAGEVWEPHVREAIARHACAERAALDAGAYVGLHTVAMSAAFREVHAFEPQPEVFRILCANLALNGCLNVRAHAVALYDRPCRMRLADQDRQEVEVPRRAGDVDYDLISNAAALSFEVEEEQGAPDTATTVDALRLDDLGFMKIDAQGSDLHILRGAAETICRCRPVVVFEYEQDMLARHGATQADLLAFMDGMNYRTSVLSAISDRQVDYIALPG